MTQSREEKGASTAATITMEQAWTIARQFAREVGEQLGDHARAVVAIGSLATEAYRPGRSDIDTALIVRDTTPPTHRLQALAQQYRIWHGIPKDFGAVVVRERELRPPYDPKRGLVKEMLRLKRQGIVLWGSYDLRALPEPSAADFRADARAFYPWLRAHYIDRRPEAERTVDAVVNTIIEELRLYSWDRQGELILDKRAVLPRFLSLTPAAPAREALTAMQAYLAADGALDDVAAAEATLRDLSQFVRHAVPWSNPP
jgi:hypothetical protein